MPSGPADALGDGADTEVSIPPAGTDVVNVRVQPTGPLTANAPSGDGALKQLTRSGPLEVPRAGASARRSGWRAFHLGGLALYVPGPRLRVKLRKRDLAMQGPRSALAGL